MAHGDRVAEKIQAYLEEHLCWAFGALGVVNFTPLVQLGGSRFTGLASATSDYDFFCGVPSAVARRAPEARALLAVRLENAGIVSGSHACTDQRPNQTLKFVDSKSNPSCKTYASVMVCDENDETLRGCRVISRRLQAFYSGKPDFKEVMAEVADKLREAGFVAQQGKETRQGLKSATLYAWCAGLWSLWPGRLLCRADVYAATARFDAAEEAVTIDADANGQPRFEVQERRNCEASRRHGRDALVVVNLGRNSASRVTHVMLAHLQIHAGNFDSCVPIS